MSKLEEKLKGHVISKKIFQFLLEERKKTRRFVLRKEFVIIWVILYLLPYLIYFIIFFTRHLCFRFWGNLTIDFAIDRANFKGADITIGFSK